MVVGDKRWLEAFWRGFHRAQVNIGAMELSDAEMDVDSGDDMSSNDMDIDSDLSLASPPPEAHDGSDCSSSMDWNDTEPPRGMNRDMSLSASSEEEGQDESEGREMDLEDSDVEMCSVQGAPPSNSWRPSLDCGIYMTGRVDSAEVQAQVLIVNVYLNLKRLPSSFA